jgi:hypothetical protein
MERSFLSTKNPNPYAVVSVRFQRGERFPFLIRSETGLPLEAPTFWSLASPGSDGRLWGGKQTVRLQISRQYNAHRVFNTHLRAASPWLGGQQYRQLVLAAFARLQQWAVFGLCRAGFDAQREDAGLIGPPDCQLGQMRAAEAQADRDNIVPGMTLMTRSGRNRMRWVTVDRAHPAELLLATSRGGITKCSARTRPLIRSISSRADCRPSSWPDWSTLVREIGVRSHRLVLS